MRNALTRRWPIAAGLAFAAFVAFGAEPGDVAPVITASAFVYLGAAALQRRAAAWPMFFVTFVVIGVASRVPGLGPDWASWGLIGIAAVLAVFGLVRGARRPPWGLPLQAAAMIPLAAVALLAVNADPLVTGLSVSAGLLAHAAWDVYHYRVQRVVALSMAEFCAALDTALAVVVLAVTLTRS